MRTFIIMIVAIIISGNVNACDYCNCYLGLDPGYNKNTVSFRSNFRMSSLEMKENHPMKVMHSSHNTGTENTGGMLEGSFLGMELFAKFYPVPKLMIVANLPYQINTLTYGASQETGKALSDMTLMGFYQIANTRPGDSLSVRHRLFGGVGVKFPTGKSSGASEVDIPMSHELYSGTGSTDYLAAVTYIGKLNKLGWNVDLSYKYNTESKNNYQYGHTFNITPRLFYETGIKSVKILPHIGAPYETAAHDYYKDEKQDETGGYVFWGSGGIDFYFGMFSFTTDVRIPVQQHMHGEELEDEYWLFGSLNFHF